MQILITSGATREPIDDVRYVGNVASGRTGSWLAEEAVRQFHTVYLLSGKGSVKPADWALDSGLLVQHEFGSTTDLLEQARAVLSRSIDVIIATAAVADYAPEIRPGKVASSRSKLTITMKPTPKVIDALHQSAPETFLVGFKLESGIGRDELLKRARRTMSRSGARMMVANLLAGHGQNRHSAILLDDTGQTEELATRRGLATRLIHRLEEEICS